MKDITSFDLTTVFAIDRPILEERIIYFIKHHSEKMPLMTGAEAGLKKLSSLFRYHCVTGRGEEHRIITAGMLNHHLTDLFHQTHMVANYFSGKTGVHKLTACEKISASVMFDDNPGEVDVFRRK